MPRPQIYLAKGEVPAEGYKFFVDELLATIREDIADCLENAYETIRPQDIGKMLYLTDSQEINAYCEQVSGCTVSVALRNIVTVVVFHH